MAKKYSTRKTRPGTGARQENQLIKRFTKIPKKKAEALEKVSEQFLRDYIEFTKYENGLPAKLLEKPHRALVLIEREMIESGDWFETSANKKKFRAALKKVEIICKLVWKKGIGFSKGNGYRSRKEMGAAYQSDSKAQ